MKTFKVAHIREQGMDLIIVFVDPAIRHSSATEQNAALGELQLCANSAGLRGTAVLVWPGGFFCDRRLHAFFQSVSYDVLYANVNKELKCNF